MVIQLFGVPGPEVVPQACEEQFSMQMLPEGGAVHVHDTVKDPEPPAESKSASSSDKL